ncbi:LysR family transcriptional regulator [Pigmentiphaga aceris]|uniref:LysR family transcriptional regulator n=1 Tax=Pigmentiphaga aceris TaxID=1940612 RepID=A0A5C0AZY9_9BURK|nr:LysR family transcriptional regulator [Pigmentiphaga aceris]QEI08032.1 LysR family transcriptional regulator [Pigmentiphaga aceris]
MNTRFVETFVILARVGNVRRVAEQLHATPGTISMRVNALEKELGVTLFDWDHKKLQLTAEGARLLRDAEALVEATRALERTAQSSTAAVGRIRIGLIETAVHTCLPDLMKSVAQHLPEVQLELKVDLTSHLAEQLMQRKLDLILRVGGENQNPYVVSEDLMELPMHWIARRGLVRARDPLQALQKQLLMLMSGTLPFEASAALVQQLAAQQGMVSSDLRITGSPSLAAMVSMVREGVGVAIMPGIVVKDGLERGELVQLALPIPEPFRISVCYPRNVVPSVSKVVEEVRKATRIYCRRLGEQWVRSTG